MNRLISDAGNQQQNKTGKTSITTLQFGLTKVWVFLLKLPSVQPVSVTDTAPDTRAQVQCTPGGKRGRTRPDNAVSRSRTRLRITYLQTHSRNGSRMRASYVSRVPPKTLPSKKT